VEFVLEELKIDQEHQIIYLAVQLGEIVCARLTSLVEAIIKKKIRSFACSCD
jgi:hypothetical protein